MRSRRSIARSSDFRALYSQGRSAGSDGLRVYIRDRSDGEPSRLGLAVGKAVGSAVERNRVKRRLREAYRRCCPERGYDVVVRAGRSAAGLGFQELAEHLGVALDRVGVETRP